MSTLDAPAQFTEPFTFAPQSEWHKPVRKTIYTLNVGDYEPRITELTYPLIQAYADKIGARFQVITERKRPEWPITIEKFQVAELARKNEDEWSYFIDSDTLINPEMFDVTEHLSKDTVAHNGNDMAGIRWSYDKYFRRDGRHIGSCTWWVVASDWTVEDLWQLPQQSPEETFKRIHITVQEHNGGQCQTEHLIDDYTLSRNIARFGLKFETVVDICGRLAWQQPNGKGYSPFLWHKYSTPSDSKVREMLLVLSTPNSHVIPNPLNPQAPPIGVGWGLMDPDAAKDFRKRWNLK